jgi:hypothetical protein
LTAGFNKFINPNQTPEEILKLDHGQPMKSVSQESLSVDLEGSPGFDTLELSPGSDRKFKPEGSLSDVDSGIQSPPTDIKKSLQPSDSKN